MKPLDLEAELKEEILEFVSAHPYTDHAEIERHLNQSRTTETRITPKRLTRLLQEMVDAKVISPVRGSKKIGKNGYIAGGSVGSN